MKCPKCSGNLQKVNTRQGVVVDHCPSCKGVWLDEGEIYLFSKRPRWLQKNLENGLKGTHVTECDCPRCGDTRLVEGNFGDSELLLDQCPSCNGLWFDDGELKKALEMGKKNFRMQVARDRHGLYTADQESNRRRRQAIRSEKEQKISALKAGMLALPNLAMRSAFSFLLLYGLLFFLFLAVNEFIGWPPYYPVILAAGILFIQYLLGPWIMDISLSWFYKSHVAGIGDLPDHLAKFIERVCREKKMKIPKMIVIEDNAPNAFTYGHTPNDARVVITRGILHYLDSDEVEAVVGHELGHARHWDILVMVMAAMVPVIMYYLYRICMRLARSARKEAKSIAFVGLGAYIMYIISEYVVLWLSRTREYWADRFSGEVTKNPNALSRALVKIAYGLVEAQSDKAKAEKDKRTKSNRSLNLEALNVFGIFDMKMAKGLALNSQGIQGQREKATAAMQWDMWNPWAMYYELHSTHPLPAKRIEALGDQAATMDQDPYLVFNRQKPESYWDEFFVDVLVHFLPIYPLIASGILGYAGWSFAKILPFLGISLGLCYFLKTAVCYRSEIFPRMKISSLLSKVKVSAVRPVPVTLKGKIIGKGEPGYVFSEDMVLQDDSGMIFLDYRQPMRIFEFFFALFRTNEYIGKTSTVQGWYRRAPVPYIEVKTLSHTYRTSRCYVYHFKMIFAALLLAGGFYFMLQPLGM